MVLEFEQKLDVTPEKQELILSSAIPVVVDRKCLPLVPPDVVNVICQCMEVLSSTESSTQSQFSQCSFNNETNRRSSVLDVSPFIVS